MQIELETYLLGAFKHWSTKCTSRKLLTTVLLVETVSFQIVPIVPYGKVSTYSVHCNSGSWSIEHLQVLTFGLRSKITKLDLRTSPDFRGGLSWISHRKQRVKIISFFMKRTSTWTCWEVILVWNPGTTKLKLYGFRGPGTQNNQPSIGTSNSQPLVQGTYSWNLKLSLFLLGTTKLKPEKTVMLPCLSDAGPSRSFEFRTGSLETLTC